MILHPSTVLVSGPTGCGKTVFVSQLVIENLIQPRPTRVIWVYSEWQTLYDEIKIKRVGIDFVKGLDDDIYQSLDPKIRNLIILDDQMHNTGDSKLLGRLFTEASHHRNLTIIYIVQNLFDKGKSHRTVSLNAQYLILFKNPRDKSQIATMGRQMFPGKGKFLVESFQDATQVPYGYLFLDLKPGTEDNMRVMTKILPNERTGLYIPT